MSILHRQLRICLAALLVVGLLLTSIVTGQAAETPCSNGEHYNTTVAQVEPSDINPASAHDYDLAACCSMSATICCASAAIKCEDAISLSRTPVQPAWLAATLDTLHGLCDEVNRRPPRLA